MRKIYEDNAQLRKVANTTNVKEDRMRAFLGSVFKHGGPQEAGTALTTTGRRYTRHQKR